MLLLETKLSDNPRGLLLQLMGQDVRRDAFIKKVRHLAKDLKAQQLRAGDRVALCTEDPVDFFAGLLGIWMADGTAVNLPPKFSTGQQQSILEQTKARFILSKDLQKTNNPPGKYPEPPSGTDLIQFTSGSTGTPKGVCLSQQSLITNAILSANAIGLNKDDKLFINTPVHFTSSIAHFLMCMVSGSILIAEPGFYFPTQIEERIKHYQATAFGGAPYHLVQWVSTIEKAPDSLRLWMSSGDHLTKAVHLRAWQLFPQVETFSFYGLTEVAGRLCVLDPKHIITKSGSAGCPLEAMNLCIHREDKTVADVGESGEVATWGPLLMKGYLGHFSPEVFPTGDVGYLDKEGFLWLEGRKDDVFKSGAEKVSTVRIQQALMDMGICEDVAVVGVQNDYLGKVPFAFIVPKGNKKIRPRTIMGELRKTLPHSHVPKHVVSMDAIPRTGAGKIQRAELTKKAKSLG